MGPKKKKTTEPPSLTHQDQGDKLKEFDLRTVSWEKSFNVVLLLPEDERSDEALRSVIESASEFQIPLTFIDRDEVTASGLDDCVLPESLDSIKASDDLSGLTKLRLVEALYGNRLRREREIERSRALEGDLKALTRDCYRDTKTRSSASFAYQEPNSQAETEQIVFDDDILCHVWTYALHGFDDIGILKSLIVDFNVPIVAIVKVKLNGEEKATETPNLREKDQYAEQCAKLAESYFESYLLNTIIMTFSSSSVDHKQILEELLYTTKSITDLKLLHLHYVRHVHILRPESTYPLSPPECLSTYDSLLGSLAPGLRTPALVLSGLLEELLRRYGEGGVRGHPRAWRAAAPCRDPCSLRSVFGRVPGERPVVRRQPTYLFHEADALNVALKFDRGSAPVLLDLTTKIWTSGDAFRDMDDVPTRRVLHKHDRNPSDEDATLCQSEKQQHMTMLLLFALLDSEPPEEPTDRPAEDDFADVLDVYDPRNFFAGLTKIVPTSSSPNTYRVNISDFIWAEELPSDALIQEITEAQRTYSYFIRRYSDELDGYLYIFTDKLDASGLNVEAFDETLSTLPCLRDFCKYVIAEKADWLKRNPTPTYERTTEDPVVGCERFADLYPEYEALLGRASSSVSSARPHSVTFGSILRDIEEYPSGGELEAECDKESPTVPAYDAKRSFVSVKGLRTTFHSHDGVKLVVDNTGFIDEEPKCSVDLVSEGFRLVLHSGVALLKQDYTFQLFFDGDDSFVTFCPSSSTPPLTPDLDASTEEDEESDIEKQKDELKEFEKVTETKVKCAFKSAFDGLDPWPGKRAPADVGRLLRAAVDENVELFKVEADVKYVGAVDPPVEVPLGDVVRRIVEASGEEKTNDVIKRYVPIGRKPRSHRPDGDSLDFRITLRDGLYVSCYRPRGGDAAEIKQEHLGGFSEGHVGHREEFRLFTRAGTVLIKRTDGNITVLRSNGDQVLLERPDGDDLPVKKCRCKKPSDYKRKLKRLLKGDRRSRKSGGAKRDRIPSDVLDVLTACKIPYKNITIVNFDGLKTVLTGNKVSQSRHCVCAPECDYSSQEVFYDRSDGLKCKTTRQSQCTVWFPDGTKITSTAHMQAELVDGYVVVSLRKTYEHPEYVPVTYDEEGSVSLTLPNDVTFKMTTSNVMQCTSGVMSVEAKLDGVKFTRTCPDCAFQYTCNFNIAPFVTKTTADATGPFVSSLDSYGKEFSADFNGVCSINSDFLAQPTNVYGCDHTDRNVYKKLFFVKKNLTGRQLWSTAAIELKKKRFRGDVVALPECDAVKFFAEVYRPPPERPSLTKRSEPPEPELSHSTYRTVRRIVDVDADLRPFFRRLGAKLKEYDFPARRIVGAVDGVAAELERGAAVRGAEEEEDVEDGTVCRCVKATVSVEEKIARWRRQKDRCWALIRSGEVGNYFRSEFCRIRE